jgi:hypothetical protein
MGTIRKSSSHSPFATEAAIGVRLLLFRPAAFSDLSICICNPWLSGIAFYSIAILLSFFPSCDGIPGRSVFQAYGESIPEDSRTFSGPFGAEALCSLKPCDSVSERTFPDSLTY